MNNKLELLYYKDEIIGEIDIESRCVKLNEPLKWKFITDKILTNITTITNSYLTFEQGGLVKIIKLQPYSIKNEVVSNMYIDSIESEYNNKQNNCNHRYSKAMGQSWPRLCVACNKPEPIN